MFTTFRSRLLFWFLVFISSSLIIIILSLVYQHKREAIFSKSEAIDRAYMAFLKSVQSQNNYYSYDTKDETYFKKGDSKHLREYNLWVDTARNILNQTRFEEDDRLGEFVQLQLWGLNRSDSLFELLAYKIRTRGYKDFSMVGSMRRDAHWLMKVDEIPAGHILGLRRHEKDYIIRHEDQYVEKLRDQVLIVRDDINTNGKIPSVRKDSILTRLSNYETKFLSLVDLDHAIGINNNSGLKFDIDQQMHELERGFVDLVIMTHTWARNEFDILTLYFGITVVLLIVISVLISSIIAHRITQPLRELTTHIARFVESSFTLEGENPVVSSQDEIGSLTRNFSILKEEVISQMKFFKQRVEERTEDLAKANEKLIAISEANSRFVPKEFVDNLGKTSIEEVSLGDQVEREMTVIFTDIRGFTKLSEDLNPQQTFDFLNLYLGGIVPIIVEHGGFIDKFIGDSVMALFPSKPDQAIKAVLAFEDFINDFNEKIKEEFGLNPVQIGTGIHTGSLILGTIGHADRLETTVISDAVNTAARVEGLTKPYNASVIMTKATLEKLEYPFTLHYRFLDRVKVKGKNETLSVYEVISPSEELKIGYNAIYKEGVSQLKAGNLERALKTFEKLKEINHEDVALQLMVAKCLDKDADGFSGWQKVTKMTFK